MRICAEEGQRALGWRDPPVHPLSIGRLARASEPVVRQLFVERRSGDQAAFERKLYVIRRRVERAAAAAGVPEAQFTIVSLSSQRLVYKGLLRAPQLAAYFEDLCDPRFESALALVHSRFSTNTFGTWDLAHPFNFLAHNGEINTVRGNANWLAAREPQLRSRAPRRRPAEALPDRRRALVGLGQARRRGRAAGARRPLARARADDARPARLDRPGRGARRRRARVLRVLALRGRAVGRAGRDRRERRRPRRRDARPQRTAPGPLRAQRRRPGRDRLRGRRAWTSTPPTSSSTAGSARASCSCSTPPCGGSSATPSSSATWRRRRPYGAWLEEHRLSLDGTAGDDPGPVTEPPAMRS